MRLEAAPDFITQKKKEKGKNKKKPLPQAVLKTQEEDYKDIQEVLKVKLLLTGEQRLARAEGFSQRTTRV